MKQDLKGKLALDTSALIELVYCEENGQKLKKALEIEAVEAYITEVAVAELRYVLCRKLGWRESNERVNSLLASGYFKIEDTFPLINEAAKTKCERALSLPDCFNLALASKITGKAVFARKEKEIADEIQKKPFGVTLLFLEESE